MLLRNEKLDSTYQGVPVSHLIFLSGAKLLPQDARMQGCNESGMPDSVSGIPDASMLEALHPEYLRRSLANPNQFCSLLFLENLYPTGPSVPAEPRPNKNTENRQQTSMSFLPHP